MQDTVRKYFLNMLSTGKRRLVLKTLHYVKTHIIKHRLYEIKGKVDRIRKQS